MATAAPSAASCIEADLGRVAEAAVQGAEEADAGDGHAGMATMTVKKSKTTMKVPVRTTARAAHGCDAARAVQGIGGARSLCP